MQVAAMNAAPKLQQHRRRTDTHAIEWGDAEMILYRFAIRNVLCVTPFPMHAFQLIRSVASLLPHHTLAQDHFPSNKQRSQVHTCST